MRITLIIAILVLMLVPMGYAQNPGHVQIALDIKDNLVSETNSYFFSQPIYGSINYSVDGSISNIKISDDKGNALEYLMDGNNIQIFLASATNELTVSYDATDVIFSSESVKHFFTEYSFDNETNVSVLLKLPAGYGIYQNSFKPDNGVIGSDGQRITITWNENTSDMLFSVKYAAMEKQNYALLIAVAVVMIFALYIYLNSRKKMRQEFISGFREDEKKTIDYLEEKKTALQSDLQKEFKFSRAKATRIVTTLESKGLVKKQRYGRTNKLQWLK